MKTRRATWLAIAAAAVLCVFGAAPTATAAPPNPGVVVEDGVTQPVFGYADAIRERVWVESSFDSDVDGVTDRIALDIMRPAESEPGLKVPVIMDASPYYSTLGRGNEAELKTRRGRRRPARQVAAVLRQLLRPARLRGRPARHGRDQQLDRLPVDRRHDRTPQRRRR